VSAPISELYRCPSCGGELTDSSGGFTCSACGRAYPVEDGVPNFLLASAAGADGAPSLVGRSLAAIVAIPFVYDLVQRLAGGKRIYEPVRAVLAETEGLLVLDGETGFSTRRPAGRLPAA
jgi:uncharacterized protein YbaR (Trm112 family)